MNERIRIDLQESSRAGSTDGLNLITELCNLDREHTAPAVLFDALANVLGMALEHRMEESQTRLRAFCEVIGPMLDDGANRVPALEEKCTLLSASLNQADKEINRLRQPTADSEGGRTVNNLEIIKNAFGEYPEDVISPIEESAKTLVWIAEMLNVISELSNQGDRYSAFRAGKLAEAARYIAFDFANAHDVQHSTMKAALISSGAISQEVSK
jgi:hypothetical protein